MFGVFVFINNDAESFIFLWSGCGQFPLWTRSSNEATSVIGMFLFYLNDFGGWIWRILNKCHLFTTCFYRWHIALLWIMDYTRRWRFIDHTSRCICILAIWVVNILQMAFLNAVKRVIFTNEIIWFEFLEHVPKIWSVSIAKNILIFFNELHHKISNPLATRNICHTLVLETIVLFSMAYLTSVHW